MSSFEVNKILGAVLGAMILAMVSGIIASGLVNPRPLEKPVYMVATETAKSGAPAAGQAAAGPEPIEPLLATASVDAGKTKVKPCTVCHTFDKGGKNGIGPNLYNVVNQPIAEGHNGYSFSSSLQAHQGQKWTVDDLNKWLDNPRSFASGTKMTFPGMHSAKDRADVIAYLNSLSDQPKPLGK
ncbi:MAG TPA: c-type cytochrome [Stellaceae bacterium]|nr:c-type cytochrome [Stellaceae bacterium]